MFPQRAAGVTLVELLVVVVIIGIVAAFAAPRFLDDRTFLQRGYYEELIAGLKYAQRLAVASGCPVRVVIDAAGYTARQHAACGPRIRHGRRPLRSRTVCSSRARLPWVCPYRPVSR